MARPPSKTARMTVYLLRGWDAAEELIQAKYLSEAADGPSFIVESVDIGGTPGWLISGSITRERTKWSVTVSKLIDREVHLGNSTAAAVLIVRTESNTFAITFGLGWLLLDQSIIERSFGLRFAIRALDSDQIKQVTRHILDSRARIDRNSVPSGQGVRYFGIEEYGEIVSRIVGKATAEHLTHAAGRDLKFSLTGSDSLNLPLGRNPKSFLSDLTAIGEVLSSREPAAELEFIDKIQALRANDPRHKLLSATLSDALAQEEETAANFALSFPWESEEEYAQAESYVIKRGASRTVIRDDELDVEHLLETVARFSAATKLNALTATTVQPCSDPEGEEVIGRAIAASKWIAAEISLGSDRFFLHQNKWYEIGQGYDEFLQKKVRNILAVKPADLTLLPWPSGLEEGAYNKEVAKLEGFMLADRKLIYTQRHPKGFEVADLIGPDNQLIHVKRTTSRKGSGPLHHLFAQGCNAMEQIIFDKEARAELWKRVERSTGRKIPEDARPNRLVFAISLYGKPLLPTTLFTFAQVSMVRAVERVERRGGTVEFLDVPTS